MATPRGAEHRDLEQRIRDLERKLAGMSTGLLGQRKLEVSEGDFVVKGGGNIVIQDAAGNTLWDALSGPMKVDRLTADTASGSWPSDTTWRQYALGSVVVPAGFHRLVYSMYVAAGATFPGAGMVGVGPEVNGSAVGPYVSSGVPAGSPCTVSSFLGGEIAGGVTPGQSVTFALRAYTSGVSNAGSCNAHVSVQLNWIRA